MSPNRIPLVLEWAPLATAEDLRSGSAPKCRCVFIWGFVLPKSGDEFVPYYVGMTETLGTGFLQHLANLETGRYKLYHPDVLHKFHLHLDDPVTDSGKVYDPVSPDERRRFRASKVLQGHAAFMVDHFHFTYARLDAPSVDLLCAKRAVADSVKRGSQVGRGCLGSRIQGVNKTYRPEHKGDPRVVAVLQGWQDGAGRAGVHGGGE